MFYNTGSFNQPLNSWNVSNVENMHAMFAYSKHFNQPLDKWDVSNVKNMENMFGSSEKTKEYMKIFGIK